MKIPCFLCFIWKKDRKQNIFNIRPLFGHFRENSAADLYGRLLYIFTRPLLSCAAEESVSWEHKRNYLPRESSSYMQCCQLLQRFPDSFNQTFRSLRKMFPGKNFVKKLYLYLIKNNTRFLRHRQCQIIHFFQRLNSVGREKVKCNWTVKK
jgi:hypothetical protein